MSRQKRTPPWQNGAFAEPDNDPLSGFANIMDVMLVFALGLLIALLSRNEQMRQHFNLENPVDVQQGKELVEPPQNLKQALEGGAEGMESLGQVYRDPETGKLILIGR